MRLELDTSEVAGYSQVDAIEVHGYEADDTQPNYGERAGEAGAECAPGASDCWVQCAAGQEAGGGAGAALAGVADALAQWLGGALQVKRREAPLGLLEGGAPAWSDSCKEVLTAAHRASGGRRRFEALDLLVVPTMRPDPRAPISGEACGADALGRVNVVHVNVVPELVRGLLVGGGGAAGGLSGRRSRALQDAVLQRVFMALGFKGRGNVAQLSGGGGGGGWAGREIWGLSSPRAQDAVADHFGVTSVPYVEVEGGALAPSSDSDDVFLESRLFLGEVMAPLTFLRAPNVGYSPFSFGSGGWSFHVDKFHPAARSAISLAALEDTGHFLPRYEAAEPLKWGKDRGAEFLNTPCAGWASHVCADQSAAFLATLAGEAQAQECSYDRVYKGACLIRVNTEPVPESQQYFGSASPNFGGYSAELDHCPVVVPSDVLPVPAGVSHPVAVDCRDTGVAPQTVLEAHGSGARCFSGVRMAAGFAGCFLHSCSPEGKLSVRIPVPSATSEGEFLECPAGGGTLSVPSLQLKLECPPARELCPYYGRDVEPGLTVFSPVEDLVWDAAEGRYYQRPVTVPTSLEAELSFDNLELSPGSVHLEAWLDGIRVARWTEDPSEGSPSKILKLPSLPTTLSDSGASRSATLKFQAVEAGGTIIASVLRTVVIVPTLEQTVSSDGLNGPALIKATNEGGDGGRAPFLRVAVGLPEKVRPLQLTVATPSEVFPLRRVLAGPAEAEAGDLTLVWVGGASPSKSSVEDPFAPGTYLHQFSLDQVADGKGDAAAALALELDTAKEVPVAWITARGSTYTRPEVAAAPDNRYTHSFSDASALEEVDLAFSYRGNLGLMWEVEVNGLVGGALPDWLAFPEREGFWPASGNFQVRVNLRPARATQVRQAVSVVVRQWPFSDARGSGAALASFDIGLEVYHSEPDLVHSCVHGKVEVATGGNRQVCNCYAGAYGEGCEYLRCPNGCAGPKGEAHGTCNERTGQCRCFPGYFGEDCAATYGVCIVSPTDECQEGWSKSQYVLNTEDTFGMTAAVNPRSNNLNCTASGSCSRFSSWTHCCQPGQLESCPFPEGSTPCETKACFVEDLAAGAGGQPLRLFEKVPSGACLGVIEAHCEGSDDVACLLYLQRTPASACPAEAAVAVCEAAPGNPLCQELVTSTPACDLPVCAEVPCSTDPFSLGCLARVAEHCTASTAEERDPECQLYGHGDGCLFEPGSAPCSEPACSRSLEEPACTAAVADHCAGNLDDPECRHHAPQSVWDDRFAQGCPWGAVQAYCSAHPIDPVCVALRGRDLDSATPIGPTSALLPKVATFYTQLASNVAAHRRLVLVMRHLVESFHAADVNGDAILEPEERARLSASLKLLRERGFSFRALAPGLESRLSDLTGFLDSDAGAPVVWPVLRANALRILGA